MTKKTSKKGGSADGSSPFIFVRSKTGRDFQRAGIRFHPTKDEPVNLTKLTAKDAESILNSQHLSVTRVSAEEYDAAIAEQQQAEEEATEGMGVPELLAERVLLKERISALEGEIALLTGRRSQDGGPKENDDPKRSTRPLMG